MAQGALCLAAILVAGRGYAINAGGVSEDSREGRGLPVNGFARDVGCSYGYE